LFAAAGAALGLGGNNIALYLLNESFPVNLALSLAFNRITFPLYAGRVVAGVGAGMRFLWTH